LFALSRFGKIESAKVGKNGEIGKEEGDFLRYTEHKSVESKKVCIFANY
jgi:hypothetical protein